MAPSCTNKLHTKILLPVFGCVQLSPVYENLMHMKAYQRQMYELLCKIFCIYGSLLAQSRISLFLFGQQPNIGVLLMSFCDMFHLTSQSLG